MNAFMHLLRRTYEAGRHHGRLEERGQATGWSFEEWWAYNMSPPPDPWVHCDCPVSTSGIRGLHHSTDCAIFKESS